MPSSPPRWPPGRVSGYLPPERRWQDTPVRLQQHRHPSRPARGLQRSTNEPRRTGAVAAPRRPPRRQTVRHYRRRDAAAPLAQIERGQSAPVCRRWREVRLGVTQRRVTRPRGVTPRRPAHVTRAGRDGRGNAPLVTRWRRWRRGGAGRGSGALGQLYSVHVRKSRVMLQLLPEDMH